MNYFNTLQELGVRPSKLRGQNFLKDPQLARAIVSFAEIKPEMPVLEIGHGLGAITEYLLEASANLIVVDIEREFCRYLSSRYEKLDKEKIINKDIRELNLKELSQSLGSSSIAVVSNLPYSISTDVINWLVVNRKHLMFSSLLLQEEYINRLIAKPNTKAYGSLSVFVQIYFDITLGRKVSGKCFYPEASVPSRVIRMVPKSEFPCKEMELPRLEEVVRACFHQKRKTISNSISHAGLVSSKEEAENILKKAGIDPKCRAENLSINEFNKLRMML